jgi:RsiW-degrading membrane proteinase PrsW (M82 family)
MTPNDPGAVPPALGGQPGGFDVPPGGLPFGTPVPARARGGRWRVLWLILMLLVFAGCGIALLVIIGTSYGAAALGVGITAAILPVPVLVGCFLWLDRYQPTPMRYLALCLGWGATVAALSALGLNELAGWLFGRAGLPDDYVGVFVAPAVEETLKALLPILLFVFRPRLFEGILDGVILCGLSATGFAMTENILYLGGHGYASGVKAGGSVAAGAVALGYVFVLRVLLSGFLHPLFTSMTGLALGIASRSNARPARVMVPIAGLILAMMMHGTWNLTATLSIANPIIILYGYVGLFVPIFFSMVGVVLWLRSREGRLAERVLPQYALAGWFSPPEVAALGTLGRRLSARRWARRVAGDAGASAMRGYQFCATQLALLRDAMDRGMRSKPVDLAEAVAQEHRLLLSVDAYRRVFVGRDPLVPPAFWTGRRYFIGFPDGIQREVMPPELPVVPVPFVLTPTGGPPPPGHAAWLPPGPGGSWTGTATGSWPVTGAARSVPPPVAPGSMPPQGPPPPGPLPPGRLQV